MHVIVVGAGIAGVSAAYALAGAGHAVTLVEAAAVGAGATGVAAGLINPFMGPKAAPVWRHAEARTALEGLLVAAGVTLRLGLVRPARDARQAASFQARAQVYPSALTWVSVEDAIARWPLLASPHGVLEVHEGGVWPNPADGLSRLLLRIEAAGALRRVQARLVGWGEGARSAWVDAARQEGTERLSGDAVVLALGGGFSAFPALAALRLHAVKGEVHEAALEGAEGLPAVAAGAYAVPAEPGRVLLGGTYDHAFTDLRPTQRAREELLARLAPVLPGLRGLPAGKAWAGVRVNAPNRLPRIGPLPGHVRVWAFTALGSKGLLLAPLLGASLSGWLASPETIAPEVRT